MFIFNLTVSVYIHQIQIMTVLDVFFHLLNLKLFRGVSSLLTLISNVILKIHF